MKIAAIQMTSSDDIAANIAQAAPLVAQAAQAGAAFVALPENAFYMRREGQAAGDVAMAQHAGLAWAQQAAKQHGIYLLVGSIRAREGEQEKPFNRSVLLAPDGRIAARYDKIHLFDVSLANGHSYRESSQALAGQTPVYYAPLKLGLSICYDLRFPALYRAQALAGAELLAVPSAFTRPTGEAHWEILLRARAIENACYVIAPAQAGTHPGGRETYGHSLIIDPWGVVLAEAKTDGPELLLADYDPARVAQVRAQLPVLQHHRALAAVQEIVND
jgi:predicted amidohydrolase